MGMVMGFIRLRRCSESVRFLLVRPTLCTHPPSCLPACPLLPACLPAYLPPPEDGRLGEYSPTFLWLLRDFYLKLEEDGRKVGMATRHEGARFEKGGGFMWLGGGGGVESGWLHDMRGQIQAEGEGGGHFVAGGCTP